MASPFSPLNAPYGPSSPGTDILVVTPNDGADLPFPARAFYTTVNATLVVVTEAGTERTIPVGAYQTIVCGITRIKATGTVVTDGSIVVIK